MNRFLIAEYCEGPFYWGWCMYEREHNDGSQNERNEWGWLRQKESWAGNSQWHVRELCILMGHAPPEIQSCNFAEWFAGQFPGGLRVEVNEQSGKTNSEPRYKLLEIVPTLPKQIHRGVIRTIRRAEASFKRSCRERNKERAVSRAIR